MTGKELAEEIRSIITDLCKVSGKQDKYALECCDELDKKLEILEMLKTLIIEEETYIFYKHDYTGQCYIGTPGYSIEIPSEMFRKLTEWLENE